MNVDVIMVKIQSFFFFDFLIWWSSWHISLVKDILTCACICGCGHGL